TAAMADYVGQQRPARVVLLTECSMSDNVALQYPELDFVRPCNLCPHMKRITLKNIRHALETMTHEVTVAPEIADKARRAVGGSRARRRYHHRSDRLARRSGRGGDGGASALRGRGAGSGAAGV